MDDIFIPHEPPTKPSLLSAIVLNTIGKGFNPRQLLMDMYNIQNKKKLSILTSDFFEPSVLPNGSTRNAMVLLKSLSYQDLISPKIVHYNRIHTSEFGIIDIPKNNAILVSDLLTPINDIYETFIYETDIVDQILPIADATGKVQFTLQFQTSCLQFYSGPEVIIFANGEFKLTKADVGLGMVDNTPDVAKIVSVPQAAAITSALDSLELELRNYVEVEISEIQTPPPGSDSSQRWGSTDW